jgi:hypothetical protein
MRLHYLGICQDLWRVIYLNANMLTFTGAAFGSRHCSTEAMHALFTLECVYNAHEKMPDGDRDVRYTMRTAIVACIWADDEECAMQ